MEMSIILAIITILNLLLGIIVFIQNPKGILNLIFLALCLSLCLWSGSSSMSVLLQDVKVANIIERTNFVTGLLISFFFFLFCKYFLYTSKSLSKLWSYFYLMIICVWTYIVYATNLFVLRSEKINWFVISYHDYSWYTAWVITFFIPFLIGLYLLRKKMIGSDGVLMAKFKLILPLIIISISGSFFFDVILVGLHFYEYNNIGPIFSLPFDFGIASLIFRNK